MNITLDPAHLSVGAAAVDARAADMAARRTHIEASVDALLASWHGDAADRFARLWEEWRTGADDVIAGLTAGAVALRSARDDLCAADASSSDAHDLLSRRLG
ncbi:WXG100 family type VII secretion target [Nocardioides sp.]|uniref:WXG100 family type VII secretion target n=1 Tax=Nocardioides sp. TaxID=35761 RepID=UPI002B9DCB59|nr:WXG100 family type VII secretion target [Nocardioides sp.]HXH78961.1 WXG100 family type VII secretion target [Nocardioides sp.]